MGRKKVELAWVSNEATRRATFKKRRASLLKKVSDLSTLCGIKACAVVYEPQETRPAIWPSDTHEVASVLAEFKSLPETEQCKKMVDREGFLRSRIAKLREQLCKQEMESREIEASLLMHQCLAGKRSLDTLGNEELASLALMAERKMKQLQSTIELNMFIGNSINSSTLPAGLLPEINAHEHAMAPAISNGTTAAVTMNNSGSRLPVSDESSQTNE